MQIREVEHSSTYLSELTTENSRITITPLLGQIDLYISDADASALDTTLGVYDLELISAGGEVTKLLRGTVTILGEITK